MTGPASPETDERQLLGFLKQPGNEALWTRFRELQKISNVRAAWSIARQWAVIVAAGLFAVNLGSVWAYAIAIFVISTRQHALGVIMHEATHYRLFSKGWANDFFGDVLCAFPINTAVSRYRHEHLLHHRHNMTDRDPYFRDWSTDPDWSWPKRKLEASWLFFKDVLSLNMHRLGPTLLRWSPWPNHFSTGDAPPRLTGAERARLYAYLVVVAGGLTYYGVWIQFLLLWLLPMSTLTVLWVRIRSVAEHLSLPGENEFNRSRHVQGHLLERLTIAPLNINVHIAHHLFPAVPQYNLPALHALLMQCPGYGQSEAIFDSYLLSGKRAYTGLLS